MSKRLRLYDLLGVDELADEVAIRRAFKRLSDPLRPERNHPDADAPVRLQRLRDAYDVLADAGSRALYDEFGEAALVRGFDARAARQKREREAEQAERRKKAALIAPTAQERPKTAPDGTQLARDWSLRIAIGKKMAHKGGLLRLPVTRPVPCDRCAASGHTERTCRNCDGDKQIETMKAEPCATCHGVGLVAGEPTWCRRCRGRGFRGSSWCKQCGGCGLAVRRLECAPCAGRGLKSIPVTLRCGRCKGTGFILCSRCDGAGEVPKSRMFTLRVPARTVDHLEYRYTGAGFASRNGLPTDLHVQFVILERAPRR